MPTAKPIAQTATATKAVTNTQMAVAVLAMLAAGGFAYIAAAGTSPAATTCYDPDAATPYDTNQLFTPTTTPGVKTDYCYTFPTGKTYLMEGACINGKAATWQKNCAELGADYSCVSGACVKGVVTPGTLSLAKDATYGNKVVIGNSEQTVGQYVFTANNNEDLCLTNILLNMSGTNGSGTNAFTLKNLNLTLNGEPFGTPVTTVQPTGNTFSGNVCIPKNTVSILRLRAMGTVGDTVTSTMDSFTYIGKVSAITKTDTTDVIGQRISFGSANVVIAAANDSTAISAIRLPGNDPQQLGKWKFDIQNGGVTLKRITFQLRDPMGPDVVNSGNFGTLSLYDSQNTSQPIGTTSYVPGTGNGYVRFDGLNFSMQPDVVKYLVLKGVINGSGSMNPASVNAFVVRSDSDADMQITAQSGEQLNTASIDAVFGDNTVNRRFATSSIYLFHNSAPDIISQNIGDRLDLGAEAKIFKFTVRNPGDRELRIGGMTVNIAANGLKSSGTAVGTVKNWKLWEANSSGNPGTLLAATSTCNLIGKTPSLGSCDKDANASTINIGFGVNNDVNNAFNDLTVPYGGERTFILTADTTDMFKGKDQGSVSVGVTFDGATGYTAGDAQFERNWSNGPFQYFYTPVNGSENQIPYTASDSYDVIGPTLTRSL